MKRFLLATVSMVALTSVARAADMPAAMPGKAQMSSPVPLETWDGTYFGVQGGVVRRDATAELFSEFQAQDGSKTGAIGGALLGYNWQHGSFVYGVEGDWSWIGAKASRTSAVTAESAALDVNWLATVRARAGLALDSTLFYVTGGAAIGHARDSLVFLNSATSYTQDHTKVGWTVGTGIEHMFAPNWTARAEVRYVDLGKTSVDCTPALNCDLGARAEFSNSLMMGLVGLNYKFGGGGSADWAQARAYAPPSAPVWTGAYFGIQGGVAHHDAFFDDSDGFLRVGVIDRKKTGGDVGVLLGHNWQQGSFVYGVEGAWDWIGSETSQLAALITNANLSSSFDVNWLATLRGRAGLALDATLVYVTGGLAFGRVKNSVEVGSTATPGVVFSSFSQNQTKIGWTAGVGAEYMLSQHWTARAEFRYVDFGKTNVVCNSAINAGSCVSGGYRGDFSNTLKLGLVGLNYKF